MPRAALPDLAALLWAQTNACMSLATANEAPQKKAETTMRSTSETTETTKTVSQGQSRYGTPEPQIELRLPKGASHRLVSAALHELAAKVEMATPERERWIVQTESFYDARGRVYLELSDATPTEADRALALLKTLVG